MAITTSAITSSFKNQLLSGTHNLDTGGQVTDSTGDYSSGGKVLQGQTHKLSGTTAIVDWADLSYLTATITAMGALIYNSSKSNKSAAVLDFVSNKTSTSGTFTIQFPNFTDTLAIIRLA